MPAEETEHERTWMCWPARRDVWGCDLRSVQDSIIGVARTISEFEAVTMLARADEVRPLRRLVGRDVEVLTAPVDDLWARDTLPNFLGGAVRMALPRSRPATCSSTGGATSRSIAVTHDSRAWSPITSGCR